MPSSRRAMAQRFCVSPPVKLLSRMCIPERLLLGPGPSNSHSRILAASAQTILGHLHPEFVQIMDEVKSGIQYAFQASYPWTMAVSGTGHAAMECALMNTVEPGDTVLIACNGIWGERAAGITKRIGGATKLITKPPGENFSNEDIEEALMTHKPKVLFVCSGESSAGVWQPLDGMGKLCHKHDCLLIVDAVASLGSVPIMAEEDEVDVIYTGSQKVLGVSPGASPIAFSERVREKLKNRETPVTSFYFDAEQLANYWGCDEGPRRYHHTAPITCVYALREGLSLLVEEGLEQCQRRHREAASLLWDGLQKLGLELLVKDKTKRLPTVTTVLVPKNLQWKRITDYIVKKNRITRDFTWNSMECGLHIPPPKELLTRMTIPERLLLGPGPSNSHSRVLAASAQPMLGHLHQDFIQIMDEVKSGIQYAFQTGYQWTMAVSGTGHAAMECALMNAVEPGDIVLVACNGIWGQRAADVVARIGGEPRKIVVSIGETFTEDEVNKALQENKPKVMFICCGESSTGVWKGIGRLCHRYDCLLVVDTVAALGAVPIETEKEEVDVIYTGSQKVLGVAPGVSPIAFSERARDKIKRRASPVPSFYFDAEQLANYWGCEESPRRYHHTAPITCMYALREGLSMLVEEGLTECQRRHREMASQLWKGLESLGLELLVKDQSKRLPTVTTVLVPEGLQWKTLTEYVLKHFSIEISGGLGPTAGKVWRIGLMGVNANQRNVERVIKAMSEALAQVQKKV